MRRLKLVFLERDEFVHHYDEQAASLFVPIDPSPETGTRVTLEVVFQQGPRTLLHGSIAWRRTSGNQRLPVGVAVTFDACERPKLTYLIGFVHGGLVDKRRRRRIPIRLPVAYTSLDSRRVNFTQDLNEEGAFVRTAAALGVGAATLLTISQPDSHLQPLEVRAIVVREVAKDSHGGVGVRFNFRSCDEQERWNHFVKRLEHDFRDGRLPEATLM